MFLNKIHFLITTSQNHHLGTKEFLPNRQIPTVFGALKKVIQLYSIRGLNVQTIHADSELEPLQSSILELNLTCVLKMSMFQTLSDTSIL